ncbi:uncharacterized protein LOC131252840 [Magnolia sinica]|uniref:uncharacterized protein LOC131252840 n=1 Tax=Magnolia sinica TaxID=86752 RepID=UPI00265B27AB|nr:uncharacterized protein LOC131252840 [Magnolia sinica]
MDLNFTRSLCTWICNYLAHCYCEGGYIAFDKEAVRGFLISTGLLSRNGKGTDGMFGWVCKSTCSCHKLSDARFWFSVLHYVPFHVTIFLTSCLSFLTHQLMVAFSSTTVAMLMPLFRKMQGELGANAILVVSIAACKAGAAEKEQSTTNTVPRIQTRANAVSTSMSSSCCCYRDDCLSRLWSNDSLR